MDARFDPATQTRPGFVVYRKGLAPVIHPVEDLQNCRATAEVQLQPSPIPYTCSLDTFVRALGSWNHLEHLDLFRALSSVYFLPSSPTFPSNAAVAFNPTRLPLKTLKIQDTAANVHNFLAEVQIPVSTSLTLTIDCDRFPECGLEVMGAIPIYEEYPNLPIRDHVRSVAIETTNGFLLKATGPDSSTSGGVVTTFTLQVHAASGPATSSNSGNLLRSAMLLLPDLFRPATTDQPLPHPLKTFSVIGHTQCISTDEWYRVLRAYPNLQTLIVMEEERGAPVNLFDALAWESDTRGPQGMLCPNLACIHVRGAHSLSLQEAVHRCATVRERRGIKIPFLRLTLVSSVEGLRSYRYRWCTKVEEEYSQSSGSFVGDLEVRLNSEV